MKTKATTSEIEIRQILNEYQDQKLIFRYMKAESYERICDFTIITNKGYTILLEVKEAHSINTTGMAQKILMKRNQVQTSKDIMALNFPHLKYFYILVLYFGRKEMRVSKYNVYTDISTLFRIPKAIIPDDVVSRNAIYTSNNLSDCINYIIGGYDESGKTSDNRTEISDNRSNSENVPNRTDQGRNEPVSISDIICKLSRGNPSSDDRVQGFLSDYDKVTTENNSTTTKDINRREQQPNQNNPGTDNKDYNR